MRIVSGVYGGRKFNPPNGLPTRPTTDFAKEGLFNILANEWDFGQVRFLDLFCGTGNISYEFASRGCEDITSVDQFPKCIQFINETCEMLGTKAIKPVQADVLSFIRSIQEPYDLIFAGPPYAFEKIEGFPELILHKQILKAEGWFILEHSPRQDFTEHPGLLQKRNYGTTIFSIFGL